MRNIFGNVLRSANYSLKELMWRPKTVQQEAIYDRLKMRGVSFSSLNSILDYSFPISAGRFPELLEEIPLLYDIISYHLGTIDKVNSGKFLSIDETVTRIRNYVGKRVAEELSLNPDIFQRILIN